MFKVYRYVKRRINDAIYLCKDGTSSPPLCSANICIILSDDQSTTSNNFGETFSNTQHGPIDMILDKDPSVIVFIGANEESFATLRQEAADKSMPPIICKVTRANPTERETGGKPNRHPWGLESFAKDLSKDNVVNYVDGVLEYYAFEMLDRATKNLPETSERTSRVIAQVKSFYRPIMPEPELLKREKTGETVTTMGDILKKVLALPHVFACHFMKKRFRVMILDEDKTILEEVTNNLKIMGLSDKEFFVQKVNIRQLAIRQITSGAQLCVQGPVNKGTLGGFAKFTYNDNENTHQDVVITAQHIVKFYDLDIFVDEQNIGTVMEDEKTYDISIAKVTASKSVYDTRFNTESGDLGFAEVCHLNHDELKLKAVHFCGAITGLTQANISEISIGESLADDYIFVEIHNNENTPFAAPGDSGAMVLMEQDPRDSENMLALGILVGIVIPPKERNGDKSSDSGRAKPRLTQSDDTASSNNSDDRMTSEYPTSFDDEMATEGTMPAECSLPKKDNVYVIVPLKNGFDYLSKKHGGRLELFSKSD